MSKALCKRYGITKEQLEAMYRDGLIYEPTLRSYAIVEYYEHVEAEEQPEGYGYKLRAKRRTAAHFGYRSVKSVERILAQLY